MAGKLKDGQYVFDPPHFLSNSSSRITLILNPWLCLPTQWSPVVMFIRLLSRVLFLRIKIVKSCQITFSLWHNRLGHPASSVVKDIISNCNVPNINKMESPFCSACCLGKIQKFPFPPSYMNILLLSSHSHRLCGPSPTPSSNGYRYCIHFIDDHTKFTWLYCENKSEAFQTFCDFKTQAEP